MKEIKQGKVPDVPQWWKDETVPEWYTKLVEEYKEDLEKTYLETMEAWEKFLDDKAKQDKENK